MAFNGKEFAKRMRESKCVDYYGDVVCSLDMWEKLARIIEKQSTEIDRLRDLTRNIDGEQPLEIIRCKDCRYCYHNKKLNTYRCLHFDCAMRPNDFCSWGRLPDDYETKEIYNE